MKNRGKRWLALALSLALLMNGALAGLALPVLAQNAAAIAGNLFPDSGFENGNVDFGFEIKDGVGFGGGKALVIPAGTKNTALKNVTLLEPLKANVPYVIRYKVKGNKHSVYWVDEQYVGIQASLPSSSQSTVTDRFVQMQYVFTAKQETDKIVGFGVYNTHEAEEAYLDDFEIFEYVPGMDMFPDTEGCAALPVTSGTAGGLFSQFLTLDGVSVTDTNEGGDYVIKFSGLDAANGTEAVLPLTRVSFSANVFDTADRDVVVSFKYKSENDAATAVISAANAANNNTVGKPTTTATDADGWRTHTARVNIKNVAVGGTVRLTFKGASEVLVKDFYLGESTELVLSDLTWTTNANQIKTGTPLQLSVELTNNSGEDMVAQNEIAVRFIARKGKEEVALGTVVQRGMRAGETVVLTTPSAWEVPAGDWVVSAHAGTAFGQGLERIGVQGQFRAADTFITAPNEALAGGFDTLTFTDEFDAATVDTEYTGDYGYKWYLTDVTGICGDKTDYSIKDGVMTLSGKNMTYNWLMATMDAYTAAGWRGFTHGYLEYRTRFDSTPEGFVGTDYSKIQEDGVPNAPAIWSFPPEVIAEAAVGFAERYVEMDWMEYWGYDTNNCLWTIGLHDQTRLNNSEKTPIHSLGNRGSNHILDPKNNIGDGQWHTVGYRWEKGLLICYVDGREVFYQDWSENGAFPQATLKEGVGELLDDAFTPLDNQLSPLILAGSAGWPLEIDYIRVWQKNEETPYKFPVDNADTPITELHWAPGIASAVSPSDDKTLCWRTDNPTVASVGSDGVISTHREGNARITAYKNGSAVQQYAITVDRYGERMPFGDFEFAANDTQSVWKNIVTQEKGSVVTESDGNRVLKLPTDKSGYLYDLKVERGKTYCFSGRVKGAANATAFSFVDISLYDQSLAAKTIPEDKEYEWVDFSYTFTTAAVKDGAYIGSPHYTIVLYGKGEGTYFDDLSLVETDGLVVQGVGNTLKANANSKNALFYTCFEPTLNSADYNITLHSQDVSILANTSSAQLIAGAFGSAYVTVTATPTVGGEALTKTVKVSVAGGNMPLFTAPHATVKFQNSSGTALKSLTAGEQINVKLSVEDGYLPIAGSLRFVTANGVTRKINNRDSADAAGNTFMFTVPSGTFNVLLATQSTAQTNVTFGTIGTAVRYEEGTQNINGVRFLTRLHIDGGVRYNHKGRLVLTYNGTEYAVKNMGSLLKRVSNTAALTLENARDSQYANAVSGDKKIWHTTGYTPEDTAPRVLDYTDGYLDFAVSMLTKTPSDAFNNRRYEVCGYIEFERADGSTFTVYSNSFVDSTTQAIQRAVA